MKKKTVSEETCLKKSVWNNGKPKDQEERETVKMTRENMGIRQRVRRNKDIKKWNK